jgi:hypothetical protein
MWIHSKAHQKVYSSQPGENMIQTVDSGAKNSAFFSLNQDIVAGYQKRECRLKHVM